jgi:hypothetical protein
MPHAAMEQLATMHAALTAALQGPLDVARARRARSPEATSQRTALEDALIADLDRLVTLHGLDELPDMGDRDRTIALLRGMAARFRLPPIYRWIAEDAGPESIRRYISVEGGPDHGFDDLVAVCQLGLPPGPKTELARNYWDEMGNGRTKEMHTVLYRRLVRALDLPAAPPATAAQLRRELLMTLLRTRRDLQPQMVGALGMVELQAGPRCERVVQGLTRAGLADDAGPFYEVHAEVDPVHGRDWVDNAVVPLIEEHPWMAPAIVRGAAWRCAADADFYTELERRLR